MMIPEVSVFARDTHYRMTVESARFWVINHILELRAVPDKCVCYAYPHGPHGFDWGLGHDAPLRGKRVRVTFEIEDDPNG